MHVFVTGASGLVGSALIPQLAAAGHVVTALARSSKSAEAIKSNGASDVILGSVDDTEVLRNGASKADAVIHLAFNHDMMLQPGGAAKACESDRTAISALCDALLAQGSPSNGKPRVYVGTSGTLGNLGPDEMSGKFEDEHLPRYLSDNLTHSYSDKGLQTTIVRLPPVVHGPSHEHPFIAGQIATAKQHGYAAYIGDGASVWPSVHVKDAAALFVLALDKAPNKSNLHAVAEEGVSKLEIAQKIASSLGLEAKSIKSEDAHAHFGFLGHILLADNRSTAKLTKEWLGWQPKEYGLIKELDGYTY